MQKTTRKLITDKAKVEHIGIAVRRKRIKKGLHQTDLARMTGISPNAISRLERPYFKNKSIYEENVIKIAKALKTQPRELYGRENCKTGKHRKSKNPMTDTGRKNDMLSLRETIYKQPSEFESQELAVALLEYKNQEMKMNYRISLFINATLLIAIIVLLVVS